MGVYSILILAGIFLLASIISVIAGSTSLITVPVMLEFGVEPCIAIATNMLALTLMSIGGTLPFLGKNAIDTRRLPLLIFLTLIGSILGALLILVIPSKSMPLIISISTIAVAVFSITNRNAGLVPVEGIPSPITEIAGYTATFILGIYGGFFSGGYVTLLTAVYVMLFRMTFVEAIATTKLINIWRAIAPIQESPLAVCDAQSIAPKDLVARDLLYPNYAGETYSITYNPSHNWFYFPQMQPDEALFIKCFDSAEDGRARFAAHTGFDDPTSPPDAPLRQSVELRTIVFYPD
ncbi:CmcJ/NvfI family oxidoreductase [Scytonema sp. NUACC26]|uniref:CmcJ/NvfI family oxidoreductase n=1 Tax=Scytonema sp. NUACC26 TaxID=3140176 RepID=UPI0034DC676B